MTVFALLAGCAGGATGPTDETAIATPRPTGVSGSAVPEATIAPQPPEASEPPIEAFQPFTFEGKGKKVKEFTIPVGAAAIAEITHNGKSNFIVNTVDASGDQVDGLVNEIGKYDGTVLIEPSEEHHPVAFEVDADGEWSTVVKPVDEAKIWDLSGTLAATGDSVYRVLPPSDGLITLELTYDGDSNFIVRTYSDDGLDDIVNEIGVFEGEVLLPNGTFLLEVTGHGGSWTATLG